MCALINVSHFSWICCLVITVITGSWLFDPAVAGLLCVGVESPSHAIRADADPLARSATSVVITLADKYTYDCPVKILIYPSGRSKTHSHSLMADSSFLLKTSFTAIFSVRYNQISCGLIHCSTCVCEHLIRKENRPVVNVQHASGHHCVGVQRQVFLSITAVVTCSIRVWTGLSARGWNEPWLSADPIGFLWRFCSQTDPLSLLGNLIQLTPVLQFKSQHGCSARAERWRSSCVCVIIHHQLRLLTAINRGCVSYTLLQGL